MAMPSIKPQHSAKAWDKVLLRNMEACANSSSVRTVFVFGRAVARLRLTVVTAHSWLIMCSRHHKSF